jgi:hypothetical protein
MTEPDFLDPDTPHRFIIFKPHSVQKMKCVPVGDPIDCDNTDCTVCENMDCSVKEQVIARNQWIASNHKHKS